MNTTRGLETLASGHVRFRFMYAGKKYSGTFATAEEASAVRDEMLRRLATGRAVVAHERSISKLGPTFLSSRSGNRGFNTEQKRWKKYIATAPFALRPLSTVARGDILSWLDRLRETLTGHRYRANKPLSWQTRKHCLNLLRSFFAWARDRDLVAANPCLEVRVQREDGDEDEGYQDNWYLSPDEQTKLLSLKLDDEDEQARWAHEKLIVAFAMGTGLRLGELACLHLADVHLDDAAPFIDVKYGSWDPKKDRYRSPKGRKGEKKSRRVVLFGLALQAARAWLAILPDYASANPHALMFPTERGARRRQPPRSWKVARETFGMIARIKRRPWWHLLRHTCASSLVAGWWGERWSLEDVRSHLGHSSVKVTERYAHLADSVLEGVATRSEAAWQSVRHDLATIRENIDKKATFRGPSKPNVVGSIPTGRASEAKSRVAARSNRGSRMSRGFFLRDPYRALARQSPSWSSAGNAA